jgi:AcrR family transcriptional regulator
MESKTKPQRDGARRRLTLAGRIALANGGGVTPQLIADVCEQSGIHPQSFRQLYPTDDAFLDAVQECVALECAERLRSSFAEIRGLDDAQMLQAAAVALARSRPIDRGAVIIRAERRLRALRSPNDATALLAAEHRQLEALSAVVAELIGQLGRDASWPTPLAARIIIETYERSFEAWVFGGGDERDFHTSSYVTRTLPTLLGRMTAPLVRTSPVTSAA